MAARNMYRIELNIQEKLCVKMVIYRDHRVTDGTEASDNSERDYKEAVIDLIQNRV